ncbi:pyrroline-5-carboxylate reductase [Cupriavidus sp. 2MCAB6]|uniref:pyrroline-5-carboxylate reductase n=1 Tax=Cupriavidus sp. 2MCAB6 TaxID=3232981 RepID=UPI003F9132FC
MLNKLKIVFVGGGNMASAIIAGVLANGAAVENLTVIDPVEGIRERLAREYGLRVLPAADRTLTDADVVVLAVKPQVMRVVCESLRECLGDALVISVAAGIRLQALADWLGNRPRLVRAMPNTPALIGQGITGMAAARTLSSADRKMADTIAGAVGEVTWVEREDQLDAITALSGSGPAYVFYFIEAMEQAAEKLGLPAWQGTQLAQQTFLGAAALARGSSEAAATLRQRVTSPGGTTAAGIGAMEKNHLQALFVEAIQAAAHRSAELGSIA